MNQLLSICIPTYNRADQLRVNVEQLILQLEPYEIPIYVSDNASTDSTKDVIEKLQHQYSLIFYSCNKENLGPDSNFEKVLKMSETEYAWLLGDDDRIADGAINMVLDSIKGHDFKVIVVNGGQLLDSANIKGRVIDQLTSFYSDCNKLLADLGWHMTWMSCLIFHRDVINKAPFENYYGSNFLQFGSIFSYLANASVSVYWIGKPLIYASNELGNPSWLNEIFEIFVKQWYEVVNSLPVCYTPKAKNKCIKDHGVKSRLFSMRGMISLRARGLYSVQTYRKYENYLIHITNIPSALLIFLGLLPPSGLTLMIEIYRKINAKMLFKAFE